MFGINGWEFLVLAVLALLVFGPDKLPRYAAEAARFLRQVRRMADSAREDVRRELGPEFRDISLADLDPRTAFRRHVLDPDDLGLDDDDDRPAPRPTPSSGPAGADPGAGDAATPAPYDPDAT